MSAYLDITETILTHTKRPMTAKSILNIAYKNDLVSSSLYGKTQHKTLNARLSEDILKYKSKSRFFRTNPGTYFLRKFLDDENIPDQFKKPIVVKRRIRELIQEPVLAIDVSLVNGKSDIGSLLKNSKYLEIDKEGQETFVWVFSFVKKGDAILTYRHGKYREASSSFLNRKSIGFRAPVYQRHNDLFSEDNHGVLNAAFECVCLDLDITEQSSVTEEFHTEYYGAEISADSEGRSSIVLACFVHCPKWFEPIHKRLSLNDLRWEPISNRPNNLDDFDPWSKLFVERVFS